MLCVESSLVAVEAFGGKAPKSIVSQKMFRVRVVGEACSVNCKLLGLAKQNWEVVM